MEALLSTAFDSLACKDKAKIRKGLKQIMSVLQSICHAQPENRRLSVVTPKEPPLTLQDAPSDPAFLEFFQLQESFEYNVATHLLTTLNQLMSLKRNSADEEISFALNLLHGLLLLHPPSRHLFTITAPMDSILDLLDTANPPSVQTAAILVLVTALLNNAPATRTFERVDGLLSIKDLLQSRETTKEVKVRVMEFLYFYLMPEAPVPTPDSQNYNTALRIKRSRSLQADEDGGGGVPLPDAVQARQGSYSSIVEGGRGYDQDGVKMDKTIKSTREKQRLLGQYLSNVDDLVQDLEESNLFG